MARTGVTARRAAATQFASAVADVQYARKGYFYAKFVAKAAGTPIVMRGNRILPTMRLRPNSRIRIKMSLRNA
jgi:hypothetical protein